MKTVQNHIYLHLHSYTDLPKHAMTTQNVCFTGWWRRIPAATAECHKTWFDHRDNQLIPIEATLATGKLGA